MRYSALGAVLAAVVVACGPPAGRLFHTTLTNPDGTYPLPVTLGDMTNLVVAVEPGAGDPSAELPSVRADPADPNVLILAWLGGACEDESVVSFWQDDVSYVLRVEARGGPGLGGGCPAIGLLRAIRITTSEPVPIDLIRGSAR